ncbi:MAG: hypothetical protein NAG76_06560 [Candidatus Pristimantibacillus lignocellulolyticus]|uniref:Uncharacterized protein n=1 Tax=Candidatus Pristimantibacillus lignocellulolyticus TaxID=2994561 RepID=A0A9J6ZIQ6_9BACL|nr:MAG: hypothetical protein NAG76_06560 [Candidatus Pristimantibacillus lignocellulolyticus]
MVLKVLMWVGKAISVVLIVCMLSIWTTGYIITSYVESILKQYEIPIEIPPMAMSGVWGVLWGSEVDTLSKDKEVVVDTPQPTEQPDTNKEQIPSDLNTEPDDEAQEVLAPIEVDDTEVAMTPEEIAAAKDTVSVEDKDRMLELLMTKLPADSWQTFSTYLEDGLTDQELIDIQQIMAQHLNDAEYEELMIILKKY